MKAFKSLALALFFLTSAAAQADVMVNYHEPLSTMSLADDRLEFSALGRDFDVSLARNSRIMAGLPANAEQLGVVAYRGRLDGIEDSWARIVVFDGEPRGLIYDGKELFVVDNLGETKFSEAAPVVYRAADSFIVPGTMNCETHAISGNAAGVVSAMQFNLAAAKFAAPGAVSEIEIAAIADGEFTSDQGGEAAALAALTTRLNMVDGYFSEQVGIQINVQLTEVFTAANDPLDATTNASALLDDVSLYRSTTPAHTALGLTHLYTGKNLDTSTVGIAWRGALCSDFFGTGLSEGNRSAFNDSLIAAHEIGHNFNAEHDGQSGSSCEATPQNFIMAPSLNGSDQFSACSIDVMQTAAARASCVSPLPTSDVGVALAPQVNNPLLNVSRDFEFIITSNGTIDVDDVEADFTLPGVLTLESVATTAGSCTTGAGTVSCNIGTIVGLTSETVTITATPNAVGVGVIDATVTTSDADERAANNNSAVNLTIDPTVDLVANAPGTAPTFVEDSTTVTATFDNLSTLGATNLSVTLGLEAGLEATAASWDLGTCTVAAAQVTCQGNTFAGLASSTLTLTATATTTGNKDVTVSIASGEVDSNPNNNTIVGVVNVVNRNNGGGGGNNDDGGGGALSLTLLTLLSVAVISRRRRWR